MANNTTYADVDKYLNKLTSEKKETLQQIRELIKSLVPEAEECISYGIPAFRYNGLLVGYAAFKNHFSFFPMSSDVIEKFKNDLTGYQLSKGTIRFLPDKELPVNLIKKIVETRKAENEIKNKVE